MSRLACRVIARVPVLSPLCWKSCGGSHMANKKLRNIAEGTRFVDAVRKSQLDTKLSLSGGLMTSNLDMNSIRIYNVAQPDGDNQPATKIW